jgi:phage tail-like protein
MSSPLINTSHGLDTDPVRNFRFLVEITPNDSTNPLWGKGNSGTVNKATLGFVSVTGFNVTTESIAYREGGYNTTVHQIPGMTSFTPITLNRGITLGTTQNQQWMKRLFALQTSGGNSGIGSDFRATVDVSVLSHPNASGQKTSDQSSANVAGSARDLHTAMRFRVYNAWISNLSYSDLNAGENNLLVESMTLVHEGWDVKMADSLTSTAAEF